MSCPCDARAVTMYSAVSLSSSIRRIFIRYAASESLSLPDIRVRHAVGLHELYKSVMILGFLLSKRIVAQPDRAQLSPSGSRLQWCSVFRETKAKRQTWY